MNKLIILLDLRGSYKGGAQRRYLNLFKHIQNGEHPYFLLVNRSLYHSLTKDKIFTNDTRIICIKVKYEKYEQESIEYNNISPGSKSKFTKIFIGRSKTFLKYLISWVGFNYKLLRIIRKHKIDTIYGIFTGGMWSCLLAKLLKIQFVYSYNDSTYKSVSKRFYSVFNSEYWPVKFADKVDFLSDQVYRNYVINVSKLKQEQVYITPNSFINYQIYIPSYPKKDLITFSSRITSIKNPDLLVKAANILHQRNIRNFEIMIIGEGPMLDEIKKLADEYGLTNLNILGAVSDTGQFLSKSKIFISIQKDNNYPSQSLLEAMACENAIVASNVGETNKLISKHEGILVTLDPVKIADAIEYLIKNPGIMERMGKSARQKVMREHSIDTFLDYFISITKTADNQ